jgi:glycogen operon protein
MTTVSGRYRTRIGCRLPGGATWSAEGTNFSVYSHDARNMELWLYDTGQSTEPFQVIALDPNTQRTYFAWHIFVEQLPVGIYLFLSHKRLFNQYLPV